ncbi:MAG TPA: hypothetical protein VF571_02340 [Pyrinomonadaceae bacterium]
MILIVSHEADPHATGVMQALERLHHPAVLIDTAAFPSNALLTQRFDGENQCYEFYTNGRAIDLSECRAGWWRRPQSYTLDPNLDAAAASFTYSECHEAISGLWEALNLLWINPPVRDEAAHHKPYQLAIAGKVGLTVPRTVITNNPDAARRFINEIGVERTVYKTFLATEQNWRETRIVRPEELAVLDSVRLAPVIFQEYIPAAADLRVTVVGDRIFAAAINAAPGGYHVDYRMNLEEASYAATEISSETEQLLLRLMQKLGLIYGAIDLRRTPDGREVFLEVNPAGEWLFVEERTGQPITNAMAELLIQFDRKKRATK